MEKTEPPFLLLEKTGGAQPPEEVSGGGGGGGFFFFFFFYFLLQLKCGQTECDPLKEAENWRRHACRPVRVTRA